MRALKKLFNWRNLRVLTCLAALLLAVSLLEIWRNAHQNPLPSDIKRQVSYGVVYPGKTSEIDAGSYAYRSDASSLTFKVNKFDTKIVFTEQPAPASLGGNQPYYPALGVHPYAQFNTKLGPVALVKFWQSGSLKPIGQTGFLSANGTLLIAHSDKQLANDQWKQLFDSLKISK